MTELIFLAGLLLAQALSTGDQQTDTVPAGVLDVHGQAHLLNFEEQSPKDAFASVEAALMMHARDASRYGLVEPGYLHSSNDRLNQLQVSERGSSGDFRISFSLIDNKFEHFEVYVRGQRLDTSEYKQLFGELQRGYLAHASASDSQMPQLPIAPLNLKEMI